MHGLTEYSIKRGYWEVKPIIDATFKHGGFIAGSYAAYMASPIGSHVIAPNDVDIFATSDNAANAIYNELRDIGFSEGARSGIAYTLHDGVFSATPFNVQVQIIKPNPTWENFPQDIVDSFDMSVTRAILTDKNTVLGDPELGHERARILRIDNPIKTLERIIKYTQRGVIFSQWELKKVLLAYDSMADERKAEMMNRIIRPVQSLPEESEDHDYDFYDGDDYDFYQDDDDYFDGE